MEVEVEVEQMMMGEMEGGVGVKVSSKCSTGRAGGVAWWGRTKGAEVEEKAEGYGGLEGQSGAV